MRIKDGKVYGLDYLNDDVKNVKIETGVKEIEKEAFALQNSIETVVIPGTITHISDKAFKECGNLKKVSIEEGVEFIGKEVFISCKNIEDVILPTTLKVIDERAFLECHNLEKIILPSQLNIMGEFAFAFSGLKEIVIPKNVQAIGTGAFCGCDKLEKVRIESSQKLLQSELFKYCRNLKSVELPDTIEEIGVQTFASCGKLVELKLPLNLQNINAEAFEGCGIKHVVFNENLAYIGVNCFKNADLERIDFCEDGKLRDIGLGAFRYCTRLDQDVITPKSLLRLGEAAFFQTGIKSVTLNEGLVNIGRSAFADCDSLEKVWLPSTLEYVPDGCFSYCKNLTTVHVSEGTKAIKNEAFYECDNLENIELPSTLTRIEGGAFNRCVKLKNVKLPSGLTYIGARVFSNTDIEEVTIPSGVKEIPTSTFVLCLNLKKVTLNEGLKIIGGDAFAFSKIKEITIPSTVEFVRTYAFRGCQNLKKVTIYSDTNIDPKFIELADMDLEIINPRTKQTITLDLTCNRIVENTSNGIVVYNENKNIYCFFDYEDNWVEIPKSQFDRYNKNKSFKEKDYKKLYEWSKRKKFIPHYTIVRAMPIDEIDNFYINNNDKKWGELVKLAEINLDEEKGAFFKLCYVLGMFNRSGRESDSAYDFIKNNFISIIKHGEYHIKFGALDIEKNRYIKEFAQLVFKYYTKESADKFLVSKSYDYENFEEDTVEYFSKVYNEFYKIKEVFPNKVVDTDRRSDMLTPQMCVDALKITQYANVDEGNEQLATNVGRYGYSQEEFEKAQTLFNLARSIPKDEITLHIEKDNENNLVTYELLDKDNPLGVILGDITNCCQTLNGVGRECLEYGLSQRNSKFLVFRKDNAIIGQSWVWYDEKTKKICLDNIEVPHIIMEKYFSDKEFIDEFLNCITRMAASFVKEMERKGFEVESITIGEGYNDIKKYLVKRFDEASNQTGLSGYSGYSDAKKQYTIYSKNKKK